MPEKKSAIVRNRRAGSKDRIIAAATELFVRQGYSATSVAQIAQQSEITVPSIYYYFGSKIGLFKAIIGIVGSNIEQEAEKLPNLQFEEALSIMLDRSIANIEARIAGLRLRLLISFQKDEHRDELQAIMREHRRKSVGHLADVFLVWLKPDDPLLSQRSSQMAASYISGLQHLCLDEILEPRGTEALVRGKNAIIRALVEIRKAKTLDQWNSVFYLRS